MPGKILQPIITSENFQKMTIMAFTRGTQNANRRKIGFCCIIGPFLSKSTKTETSAYGGNLVIGY